MKSLLELSNSDFIPIAEYFKKQKPDLDSKKFVDQKFPPEQSSLTYIDWTNEASKDTTQEELDALKSLVWKRPNEIFRTENYYLFETIDISDIHQGQLGNCYFLSALSATAEYNERFQKIFISKTKSVNGCYVVRMMIQGVPKVVCVDDHFPTLENFWALAYSGPKELWVQVLEKAWAKVNKSYASTIAGLPSEALSCLTEAPCFSYIHRKYDEAKIWDILHCSDNKGYILCTNTGNNKDAEEKGLVQSHAYTIISAHDIKGLKLVKIRNPWGSFEWKGDYSDKSPKWNEIPELKKLVGYKNSDDGEFFMSLSDFLTYFPYTFVCKFENDFHYNCKKVQQENNDQMTCAKFVLKAPTKIVVGLHQKQQRFYTKVKSYKPSMSRVILARYTSGGYEFINSDSSDQDKLYIECEQLPAGEYHIFGNVHWPYQTNNRYTYSTYAQTNVEVQKLDNVPTDYLFQLLKNYMAKNSSPQNISPILEIRSSFNDNDIGYYMSLFTNKSNDNLKIKANYAYNDKCQLISGEAAQDKRPGKDALVFNVPKHGEHMVVYKLLAMPWHAKLQLGEIEYSEDDAMRTTQDDPYRNIIEKNIKNLLKENLNLEVLYSELDVEDGVIIVLENKTKNNHTYRFRVNFSNLVNLELVTKKNILSIGPNNFEYVRLRKVNFNDSRYDFSFNYSFKKL